MSITMCDCPTYEGPHYPSMRCVAYWRDLDARIAAAFAQDRSEQYKNSSGCRVALEDLAAELADKEHVASYEHGELDDLMARKRLSRKP